MSSRFVRLERARLIRRVPDPGDRRGVLVHLTSTGSKRAERALAALIAANEAFLEPLDAAQRGAIASSLKQLLLAHEGRPVTPAP